MSNQSKENNNFTATVGVGASNSTGGSSIVYLQENKRDEQVLNISITEERIEIVKKYTKVYAHIHMSVSISPTTCVCKEIYRVIDGKIAHTETLEGTYIPESHTKESYNF